MLIELRTIHYPSIPTEQYDNWRDLIKRAKGIKTPSLWQLDFFDEDEFLFSSMEKGGKPFKNQEEMLQYLYNVEKVMRGLIQKEICGECNEWFVPSESIVEGVCCDCCEL